MPYFIRHFILTLYLYLQLSIYDGYIFGSDEILFDLQNLDGIIYFM